MEPQAAGKPDKFSTQDRITECDGEKQQKITQDEKKTPKKKNLKPLYQKLCAQMEFYFSDSCLYRDRFLKQHVMNSKDGYVDLNLFLTFNKIKVLTDDVSFLAHSLSKSKTLEVNPKTLQVRRKTLLQEPKSLDQRVVYVENLPIDVTITWLQDLFSRYGKVLYVSLPRYKLTKDPKGFAFIEFDTTEAADLAIKNLNNPLPEKPGRFPRGNKTIDYWRKRSGPMGAAGEAVIGRHRGCMVWNKGYGKWMDRRLLNALRIDFDDSQVDDPDMSFVSGQRHRSDDREDQKLSVHEPMDYTRPDDVACKRDKREKRKSSSVHSEGEDNSSVQVSSKKSKSKSEASNTSLEGLSSDDISVERQRSDSSQMIADDEKTETKSKKKKKKKKHRHSSDPSRSQDEESAKVADSLVDLVKVTSSGCGSSSKGKLQEDTESADKVTDRGLNSDVKDSRESKAAEGGTKRKLTDADLDPVPKKVSRTVDGECDAKSKIETRNEDRGTKRSLGDTEPIHVPRKILKYEDSEPGTKPPKKVTLKTDQLDESEPPGKENNKKEKGESSKKKRRRKNNWTRETNDKQLHLRVIPKMEWLKLKEDYKREQKEEMAALKRQLKEIQKRESRQRDTEIVSVQESGAIEKKATSAEGKNAIPFVPNAVVAFHHSDPTDRKRLLGDLGSDIDVAYVDMESGGTDGYIRCKNSESAEKILQKSHSLANYSFRMLQGTDEKAYWKKLFDQREEKLNKKRPKKKGQDKIMDKVNRYNAEEAKRQHIVFSED